MNYTCIYPTYLTHQGAPTGGKLVNQKIGGRLACRKLEVVFVYRVGEVGVQGLATAVACRRRG